MESEPSRFEYRLNKGSSAENIPFELNANKPYLLVRINGAGPYWFILDTGSISTVADTELAKMLDLASGDSFEATGAGEGSITGATGKRVALSLDGLDLSTEPIDLLPINRAISFSEGRRVDGLLGYDFFHNFVVVIDYCNQRFNVYERGANLHAGRGTGALLLLDLVRGHPFVSAALTIGGGEQLAGRFLVDTAWRSALTLNAPFVAVHRLLSKTKTIQAITGVGVGGPTIDQVGRVETLQIGPLVIQNPITSFSTATAGILAQSDMCGIIGGEVLRRFTVTLDYPHKQMMLEPNGNFAQPYEFDMSGFMVAAEGEDLKTLRVYHITEGSPGHEAGLREGDVITAINQQLAAGISLEQVRRLFRQEAEKVHEISVLRDGQLMDVNLRLHRLV